MNINELAQKYENFKNSLIRHSELQLTDNTELVIYGCKRVIQYDENYIKLELAANGAVVDGLELSMSNFSSNGVIIRGKIHSVTFMEREML